MAERRPIYMRWLHAGVLAGFSWIAILVELAPLGGRADASPAPDLLFCIAAFLSIRRPRETPLILVALLALFRDIIGGGPTGPGALSLTFAVWLLQMNAVTLRRRGAFYELGVISVMIFSMALFELVFVTIALAPSPPLSLMAIGIGATIGAYSLLALFMRWVLRIDGDSLEKVNQLGRRTS